MNEKEDRYTKLAIQPFEYSYKNKLDAYQHTAIKYITRFRDKNGKEDIDKAIDTLQQLKKAEWPDIDFRAYRKVDHMEYFEAQDKLIQDLKDSGKKFDCILAVSRGGLTPAHFIAEALGVTRVTTDFGHLASKVRLLVVEDITDTGESSDKLSKQLQDFKSVTTAAVYERESSTFTNGFVGEVVKHTNYVHMPWEVNKSE